MRKHTRNKTVIKFPKKGKTKQWHKKECDINQIMASYQKTGIIDHVNRHQKNYGFASSEDLHESLNMINTANEMFADLPSQARAKFENDPAQFLDFVQDPKNESELYELGLSDYPFVEKEKSSPNVESLAAVSQAKDENKTAESTA